MISKIVKNLDHFVCFLMHVIAEKILTLIMRVARYLGAASKAYYLHMIT